VKLVQTDWLENGIKNIDKALSYIKDFPYSSFQDFQGISRKEGLIISKNSLPGNFKYNHVNELFEWIKDPPFTGPVRGLQFDMGIKELP